MTHAHEPSDQQRADALGAYGDALVDGYAPPPTTDIERTMARAYQAMQAPRAGAPAMPTDRKQHIWEDVMTARTTTVDRFERTPHDRSAPARWATRRGMRTPRGGWQAVASFVLVLGVLAALVTLAWQQGMRDRPGEPTPALGAQALYDADDPASFPRVPETCIPNGEVPSDEALATRSIDDRPAPEYAPAKAVSYAQGTAIQDTYLHYLRCEVQAVTQAYSPGATPPVAAGTPPPPLEASPAMRTYFSDRLLYDHLYGSLSPEQQADLDTYRCQSRIDAILETFPLPVNQPKDYAVASLLPNGDIDELAFTFSPADVYLMPDGRYGVVMGTVTTAALDDPNAVTPDDFLTFIAFVEEDGRYFIDEIFTLFAPDMATRFPEGRNGTIVMDCD